MDFKIVTVRKYTVILDYQNKKIFLKMEKCTTVKLRKQREFKKQLYFLKWIQATKNRNI